MGGLIFDSVEGTDFDADTSIGIGVVAGFTFDETTSFELSHTRGDTDAEVSVYGFPFTGDTSIETTALYAVYRSNNPVYYLLKAGIGHEKVELDVQYCGMVSGTYACINGKNWDVEESVSDSGLTLGLGGGWKLSKQLVLEAELTLIEKDVNYITLEINYYF